MRLHLRVRNSVLGAVAASFFALASVAYADTGIITAPDQYAWGNDTGWINFAPSQSTITVSDSSLTGYAWSENDGWINLSPANGGVTNNNGTLGGWAWDQSVGWISFSGVTIDSSGTFHGEATGANSYAINFDCANCDVATTWRPASSNTTGGNTTTSSPGAISPVASANTTNPQVAPSTPPPVPPPSESTPNAPGESASSPARGMGSNAPYYPPPSGIANIAATSTVLPYIPPASSVATTSTRRHASVFRPVILLAAAISLLVILAVALWFFL